MGRQCIKLKCHLKNESAVTIKELRRERLHTSDQRNFMHVAISEGCILLGKLEIYRKDLLDSRNIMNEGGTDSGNRGCEY